MTPDPFTLPAPAARSWAGAGWLSTLPTRHHEARNRQLGPIRCAKLGRSPAIAIGNSLVMTIPSSIPAPETAERQKRLESALDAARDAFAADIRTGRGGRAAHERFSDRFDELLRSIVERRSSARQEHGRGGGARRLRPARSLPAFGHRSAGGVRGSPRPRRGALRQGAAASALGFEAPGRPSGPAARRLRRARARQPAVPARAHRRALSRRRRRRVRAGARRLRALDARTPAARCSTRCSR